MRHSLGFIGSVTARHNSRRPHHRPHHRYCHRARRRAPTTTRFSTRSTHSFSDVPNFWGGACAARCAISATARRACVNRRVVRSVQLELLFTPHFYSHLISIHASCFGRLLHVAATVSPNTTLAATVAASAVATTLVFPVAAAAVASAVAASTVATAVATANIELVLVSIV